MRSMIHRSMREEPVEQPEPRASLQDVIERLESLPNPPAPVTHLLGVTVARLRDWLKELEAFRSAPQ